MLLKMLDGLGCCANESALVSDTVEDLEDARSAGMQTIGLLHSTAYNSADRIEAFRPDHTVVSFEDLQNLLTYI
jgi:phosphoglycolate phosphatase-like HAD superfamily hydrolase